MLILVLGWTSSLQADTVWLKDGTRLHGRVVSRSTTSIQWLAWDGSAFGEMREIDRNQVAATHVNFDSARLNQLTPERPTGYLEYAEELAMQTTDPTALRLAKRLYWLAALHGNSSKPSERWVVTSGLTGLRQLESNGSRKQELNILLALKSGRLTSTTKTTPRPAQNGLSPQPDSWLDLLRAIRRERRQAALQILANPNNQTWLDDETLPISRSELDRLSRSKLSDQQLRLILQLELKALAEDEPTLDSQTSSLSWWEQGRKSAAGLTVLPSLGLLGEPGWTTEPFELNKFDY